MTRPTTPHGTKKVLEKLAVHFIQTIFQRQCCGSCCGRRAAGAVEVKILHVAFWFVAVLIVALLDDFLVKGQAFDA